RPGACRARTPYVCPPNWNESSHRPVLPVVGVITTLWNRLATSVAARCPPRKRGPRAVEGSPAPRSQARAIDPMPRYGLPAQHDHPTVRNKGARCIHPDSFVSEVGCSIVTPGLGFVRDATGRSHLRYRQNVALNVLAGIKQRQRAVNPPWRQIRNYIARGHI